MADSGTTMVAVRSLGEQETSPEWTPDAPESERKPLPTGLSLMDELSKKIGAKRQSQAVVEPSTPPEEVTEERQNLLSTESEPVEHVVAESKEDEGAVAPKPQAKKPPPLPQAKSRPPPLPRKNSSESIATSASTQQVSRVPARKPSSDSLPTAASSLTSLTENRLAREQSSESLPTVSTGRSEGRTRATTVAVTRSRSPCGSEAETSVSTPRSAGVRSFAGVPNSVNSSNSVQANDDLLLFSSSTSSTLKGTSRSNDRQVYNTWQQKNIDSELQITRGQLNEARANSGRLEEQVRALQHQNMRLQQQLDIQNDSQEMLRDIRNRVRGRSDSESMDVPRFREPVRRPGLCGSVCSLFGRA